MSLLGSQVFANPDQPIWLSATNPVIEGSLTVEGTLTAEDTIVAEKDITFQASDDPNTTVGRIIASNTATGRLYLQANTDIAFGKVGVGLVNTALTLGTGGNADDVLNVAGDINTINMSAQSYSPLRGTASVAGVGPGVETITFGGGLAGNIILPDALYLFSMNVVVASGGVSAGPYDFSVVVGPSTSTTDAAWAGFILLPASPELRIFSVTGLIRGFGPASQPLEGDFTIPSALPPGSTITFDEPMLLRID